MIGPRRQLRFLPARRRGGAAVEFAMSIPVIAVIFCLILVVAWGAKNQQNTTASARYAAWKEMHSRSTGKVSSPSTLTINTDFFSEKASTVTNNARESKPDTFDMYNTKCGELGDMAKNISDSMPSGISGRVDSSFPGQGGLWDKFPGNFHSEVYVDDPQWSKVRYSKGDSAGDYPWGWATKNRYYDDLDESLSSRNNEICSKFRELYFLRW